MKSSRAIFGALKLLKSQICRHERACRYVCHSDSIHSILHRRASIRPTRSFSRVSQEARLEPPQIYPGASSFWQTGNSFGIFATKAIVSRATYDLALRVTARRLPLTSLAPFSSPFALLNSPRAMHSYYIQYVGGIVTLRRGLAQSV